MCPLYIKADILWTPITHAGVVVFITVLQLEHSVSLIVGLCSLHINLMSLNKISHVFITREKKLRKRLINSQDIQV